MAYTKIIPVRSDLNRCLSYTSNPEKTEVFQTKDLERLLSYTRNNEKTEYQLYVAGFNCDPATAFSSMQATKRRWNKPENNGVLGYHIIQSFTPKEVTPEQCFEIGCEFARRFLAERFECTVSTHLDQKHLHCHIVFNSVSFADGRMFRNDFKSYYQGIRKISDELCREYKLSVIETDGHGLSYGDWKRTKQGQPTVRSLVKADADRALLIATSYEGFLRELENMGYQVNASPNHKYTSVIPPGRTKSIRLEKLSPQYEETAVHEGFLRELENMGYQVNASPNHKYTSVIPPGRTKSIRLEKLSPQYEETAVREYYRQLQQMPRQERQQYQEQLDQQTQRWMPPELLVRRRYRSFRAPFHPIRHKRVRGFMALYYHYCALLRKTYRRKSSRRCYYLLRQEFLKFDRYLQQCDFLWQNHIETSEDLAAFKARTASEMDQLILVRSKLYRQKGGVDNVERTTNIKSLTAQIRQMRRDFSLCAQIESDADKLRQQLVQAHTPELENQRNSEVIYHEQRRRGC